MKKLLATAALIMCISPAFGDTLRPPEKTKIQKKEYAVQYYSFVKHAMRNCNREMNLELEVAFDISFNITVAFSAGF